MPGLVALAMIGGCSTEYALQSIVSDPGNAAGTMAAPVLPEAPADGPIGEPPSIRIVEIGGGVRSDIADYLFVVDSSASMTEVLNHVLAGFDAIEANDVFPHGTRIGVMSTLPASPLRRTAIHPRARQRWWLQFQPGFQSMVDADAIAVFRELAPPHVAERYALDGCDGWFGPADVNAKGVSCLVANTQLALYPVLVEAGLLALEQRLERSERLFRSGAAANVIFVSDTHDPGLSPAEPGYAEMVAARPSFEKLRTLALSRQPLASFRIHAVAPAELCADEDWTASGPSYFEAARASGGQLIDVCSATPADYVAFVQRMAEDGAVPQAAVIPLVEGEEVVDVVVDGERASYAVSEDGRAVTLANALPAEPKRVQLVLRRP